MKNLKDNADDLNLNKILLPGDLFSDFKEIHKENQEDFEFFAGNIIVQYLEKIQDKKGLEFPEFINSNGR